MSQRAALSRAARGAIAAKRERHEPRPAIRRSAASAVRLRFQSERQSEPARAALARWTASRTIAGEAVAPGLVQKLRKLEDVGDLLARPGPMTVQRHRQRQLVEPRRLQSPGRPNAEKRQERPPG